MLNAVFLILSILGSCGIVFGASISPWWLFALIPGLFVAFTLLYLVYLAVTALILGHREPKKINRFALWNFPIFMNWLMQVLFVKLSLHGAEKLPSEPCVIASNHRSVFDPMTTAAVLRHRKLLFISKESNFKIPVAAPFMIQAGYLAIDRENGMRALRTLKKAADRMVEEQADFGIYPEGTRSKTGELLPFKTGAFYLAKKANAPIVVMTVWGTEKVGKSIHLRRTKVDLDILAVIDKETVQSRSLEELAEMTRDLIAEHLKTKQ